MKRVFGIWDLTVLKDVSVWYFAISMALMYVFIFWHIFKAIFASWTLLWAIYFFWAGGMIWEKGRYGDFVFKDEEWIGMNRWFVTYSLSMALYYCYPIILNRVL